MARGGNLERLAFLRQEIARIEGGGHEAIGSSPARLALGPSQEGPFWLDAALGGGLARGALYEVGPGRPGDEGAGCAFALALAARFAQSHAGPIVWAVEDFAVQETGAPYGPGLREWGLDPARLILVRTANAQGALWALEEALKCPALAAVMGEFWGSARHYGPAAARRLVLAARRSGVPCILAHPFRPLGSWESPGAQARFAVFAAPASSPDRPARRPPPLMGAPGLAVQILKTRFEGGCAAAPDPESRRLLVWELREALFGDPSPLCPPSGVKRA